MQICPATDDRMKDRAAPGYSATDSLLVCPGTSIADKIYPDFVEGLPSLSGKCVAITGTTSGTGYWAALAVAKKNVGALLLLNRQTERSKVADADVVALAGARVHSIACDLSKFESVREAIPAIASIADKHGGLDVLCLNAGVMQMPDDRTVDGYDIQMQVNHLSHSILANKLMPQLEKAAESRGEARVVYHSSGARFMPFGKGPFKFGGAHFTKCPPGSLGGNSGSFMMVNLVSWQQDRYSHSKLANAAYTMALHDKLTERGSKVKAICVDPGGASTMLQQNGWKTRTNSSVNACAANLLFSMIGGKVIQSGGDGACPLMEACFSPEANSGDIYAPEGSRWWMPFYLTGSPRKVIEGGKPATGLKGRVFSEKLTVSEENKKAAWDATQAAIDAF